MMLRLKSAHEIGAQVDDADPKDPKLFTTAKIFRKTVQSSTMISQSGTGRSLPMTSTKQQI